MNFNTVLFNSTYFGTNGQFNTALFNATYFNEHDFRLQLFDTTYFTLP